MSKLSKRDSTLLILIGVIALIGGIYWFYVKPARADLTSTKQAAQEAQTSVDDLQSQLQRLTAQASKPRKVALADELLLAKAYPYSEDIPVLILQIEAIAKQSGVELGEVTSAESTDYAGVTGTPFTVAVTGKYLDVQDFLYRMHNRVNVNGSGKLRVRGRMLAVTKADLTPDADPSTTGSSTTSNSSGKVSASITIVAFSRTAGGAAGDPQTAAPSTNPGGTS
jgi:Pilus assembly protein, PilO